MNIHINANIRILKYSNNYFNRFLDKYIDIKEYILKKIYNFKYIKYLILKSHDIKFIKKVIYRIDENNYDYDYTNELGSHYQDLGLDELTERYYKIGADNNHVLSQSNLGIYYMINFKYELAEKYLLLSANKNNKKSQYYLGCLYQNILFNHKLTEKYYLLCIENNENNDIYDNIYTGISQYNLALFYQNIKNDNELTEKYLKLSADNGVIFAQNALGNFYFDTIKNYGEAQRYYKMASKYNTNAQANLGCFYENVKKNYKLAIYYYLKSANNGNINAYKLLGCVYEKLKNYGLSKQYLLLYNEENYKIIFDNFNINYKQILPNNENTCLICYTEPSTIECNKCRQKYCYNCIYKWAIIECNKCTVCKS